MVNAVGRELDEIFRRGGMQKTFRSCSPKELLKKHREVMLGELAIVQGLLCCNSAVSQLMLVIKLSEVSRNFSDFSKNFRFTKPSH